MDPQQFYGMNGGLGPLQFSPPPPTVPYSPSKPIYSPSEMPQLPHFPEYSSQGRQYLTEIMSADLTVTDGDVATCQPLYEWLEENGPFSPVRIQSPNLEARYAELYESPESDSDRLLLDPIDVTPERNPERFIELANGAGPNRRGNAGSAESTPDGLVNENGEIHPVNFFTPPNAISVPRAQLPTPARNTRLCWMLNVTPRRKVEHLRMAAKANRILSELDENFTVNGNYTPDSRQLVHNYFINCNTVLAVYHRKRKHRATAPHAKRRLF